MKARNSSQYKKNYMYQKGFTLVEIAVVLVIIGVLLGGVLQGTKLIENSKVKKLAGEVNGITAAYHAYQDKYGRQPGDDGTLALLQARGGDWASVPRQGNRNGAVRVGANGTFTGWNENYAFWQHLRASGLITGDPAANNAATVFPVNAYGGRIGLTNDSVMNNLNGLKLCLSQIPGSAAVALDNQLDNGLADSGKLRSTLGASGTNTVPAGAATAYDETAFYTVCTLL